MTQDWWQTDPTYVIDDPLKGFERPSILDSVGQMTWENWLPGHTAAHVECRVQMVGLQAAGSLAWQCSRENHAQIKSWSRYSAFIPSSIHSIPSGQHLNEHDMKWSVPTNVVLTQVKTSAQLTCIRLGVRHSAPTRLLILSKKLSVKHLNCAYFRCYFVFVLVMLTAVHKKGKRKSQRRFDTFTAILSILRA